MAVTKTIVRPWLFAWLLAFGVAGVCRAASGEFPYTGIVAERGTLVHSGPGSNHYTTGSLQSGAKVEVYRREPNGWLAIRPPAGSLSLVPGEHLRLSSSGDLAEVISADATAWVGRKSLAGAPLKWQVRLQPGEVVEILGAVADPQDPQKKLYKISPPAGEFRWLAPDAAVRDAVGSPGQSLVPSRASAENRILAPPDSSQDLPRSSLASDAPREKLAFKNGDWLAAKSGAAVGFVEIRRRIEKQSGQTIAFVKPRILRPLPASPAELRKRLGEIEVEISLMAAQPRKQWDFAPLSVEADALLDSVNTATARSQIQRLQKKIREFADLAQRAAKMEGDEEIVITATAAALETPVLGQSVKQADVNIADAASDSGFDGVGWLMPVVSRTRSAPPFALMDDNGQVKLLLSPAPGVNLHRYMRQKVGVFGQRGFSPSLNLPHVAARRVVIVERAAKKR